MELTQNVDKIIDAVKSLGVATIMCGWFAFRMEKKTDDQTAVLNEVLKQLILLNERLAHLETK